MIRYLIILSLIPSILNAQSSKELSKLGIDSSQHLPMGLNVGEIAPAIVTQDVFGNEINSTELSKGQHLVIMFYRGEWCPYCNRHLSNISDSLSFIEQQGAKVLVIGPETFEHTKKYNSKSEFNFTLISDTSLQLMTNFDVLFGVNKKYQKKIKTFLRTDIAQNNGQTDAKLPVPATYIINSSGKITWRHFNYQYSERASALSIIKALKAAKNSR